MTTATHNGTRYGHLTAPTRLVPARAVHTPPPLPVLVEPADQPPVLTSSPEHLIPVSTVPGVGDIAAYHQTGWDGAVPHSLVREGAADRLADAACRLPAGFTLAIFDAWRPMTLQQRIYDTAYLDPSLPEGFVSVPSTDPTTPPPHLTGGTVDVTLAYHGVPLALGTEFDDFTATAHANALEHTHTLDRDLRRVLFHAMSCAGFVVIACEWWHFEYGTRRWAAIRNTTPIYGPAFDVLAGHRR
jgi:D-alanyl-D-alanine dipeptidase